VGRADSVAREQKIYREGASLNRKSAYSWKRAEDLKRFVHILRPDKKLHFCLRCYFVVAEESLEVCRHWATKCLHWCTFYCIIGNNQEAISCVELVRRWVSFDLYPYTCCTWVVGWLVACINWTTAVMFATYVSNTFRFLYSNIWWIGCYVFPQIDRTWTRLVEC